MIAMNRKVLDLSHHNGVSSWSQIVGAGIVGVIHKATEGTSYVDENYWERREAAHAVGLRWGAYHFATGSDVSAQVAHFLDVVGIDESVLYALDWEENPNGSTMSLAQAREFLERMADRIGANRCVLYSGNLAKERLGNTDDEFFGRHRLWLAQYGSSPTCQRSWESWWLWQYSDGKAGPQPHGCPGVTGDVDTNSWDGTDDELRAQWSGARAPVPAPRARVSIDIVADGAVDVFVNGKPVR